MSDLIPTSPTSSVPTAHSGNTPAQPTDGFTRPAAASSELTELKEQCAQLRAQTHNLRIAQLIVALAVAGFFWVEARRNGQALKTMRPQAAQIEEASKKQMPAINDFLNRLTEYSRTHPDFVPILTKHSIRTTPAPASPGVAPVAPKK
jgi:hypothetical protein